MKRFRNWAFLAAIAGLAAFQGRQLHIYAATGGGQLPATTQNSGPSHGGDAATAHATEAAAAGGSLFQQNCAFCHGRDAGGGETGPDLTRSKLVSADVGGDKIGDVVLHGRPDKGMPAFNFSSEQITNLAAFIHSQQNKAMAQSGKRKGVDVSDLQTGNVAAGKAYFNGPGGCATCHSPTGDLAGIASRYEGLQLEERMLYPKDVTNKVTVTLPSGETVSGKLAYLDEFTVGLRDAAGTYRSWPVSAVKVKVDAQVEAHVALFSKYTDDDIHNLMAYMQTLR
jgi:cytochrome c oxidase cbb3-type subunit 3